MLLHATQGIASLITGTGLINVDFADVRTVMQNGGSALMGTGIGRGENRAMEAAQQAISSPLLDNVSIAGATGVLINITGGDDLTLGETTQINEIIHDAVGDDAEIIFGAGNEPRCRARSASRSSPPASTARSPLRASGARRPAVGRRRRAELPDHARGRPSAPVRAAAAGSGRAARRPVRSRGHRSAPPAGRHAATRPEMEIPTFIRRQMD